MRDATRDGESAGIAEVEELRAAAQRLAAIVGTCKATRAHDWQRLCRSPLANAVDDLTSAYGPFALDADQARCVKEVVDLFRGVLPEAFEELRLCSAAYGLDVIVDMLAAADGALVARRKERRDAAKADVIVRRRFAHERDEVIKPYRRPSRRHTRWVV